MIESSNTERKPQTGRNYHPKTLVTRVGLTHWMFLTTRQHTAIQQPMLQKLIRYLCWLKKPRLPAYSAPPGPNLETMTTPAAAPTPAATPTAQPKLKSPVATASSKSDPLPVVCGQSPADWSTMDDPRCRKHAGLPRGQVPPCWACGQVRLWFTQQALVVKQAQRNKITTCEYCDERGLAETRDESGKRLLIRCSHDGLPPILPVQEKPQHRPPPPEIRERIAKLGQPKPTKHQPLVNI